MIGVDEDFDDNLPLIIYTSRDKMRLYFVDYSIFFTSLILCVYKIISNGNQGV